MNHSQDKFGSRSSSSTGSEEELRVRFAPLAEESLFTERDPSNERSESQQVPTKTSDHHVSMQGDKTARQRTSLRRKGYMKVCIWNPIQNTRAETNNHHTATTANQEAQVVHQDLKVRYHEVLTSLNDSLQALKTSGASQSLQRLARLKARRIRRPMQIFFQQRCQICVIALSTKGLISFNSWVAKAKAVELETGSLIELNHRVDLEIEDAADELVQQEINDMRADLNPVLPPRIAKIVAELRSHRRLLLHAKHKGQKELAACYRQYVWMYDGMIGRPQADRNSTACPRCGDLVVAAIGFCTQCCSMLTSSNTQQLNGNKPTDTKVEVGSNPESDICHYENCLHHDLCGMRHITCLDCMWTPTHRYCLDCRGTFICRLHCSGCDWELEPEEGYIYCQVCGELNVYTVNCGSCGLYKFNGRESDDHGQDCTRQCSKFKAKGRVLCTYRRRVTRSPEDSSDEDLSENDEDEDSDSSSDSDDSDDCPEDDPESPYANQSVRDPSSTENDAEVYDISEKQPSGSNFNQDKAVNEIQSVEEDFKTPNPDAKQPNPEDVRRCSRCSWVLPSGRKPCVKFHFGMDPRPNTNNNEDLCNDDEQAKSELCNLCQYEELPNSPDPTPSIDRMDLDIPENSSITDTATFQILPSGEHHHTLLLAPGELPCGPESPISPTFCDWASSPPHTFTPSEVTEIIARWRAKNKRHRQPSSVSALVRRKSSNIGQPPRSPIRKRSSGSTLPPSFSLTKRCSVSLRQADRQWTHMSRNVSLPFEPPHSPLLGSEGSPNPSQPLQPPPIPTDLIDLTLHPFLSSPYIHNLHKLATLNALTRTLFTLESQPLCPISVEPGYITVIKGQLRSQIRSSSAELGVTDSRADGISLDEAFALLSVRPEEARYEKQQIKLWRRVLAQSRGDNTTTSLDTEHEAVIDDEDLTKRDEDSNKENNEASGLVRSGYILGTDVYCPPRPRSPKRRLSSSSSNEYSFHINDTPPPKRIRTLAYTSSTTLIGIPQDGLNLKRKLPFSEHHHDDEDNIDIENHSSINNPKAKRIRTSLNSVYRQYQASDSDSSSSSSSTTTTSPSPSTTSSSTSSTSSSSSHRPITPVEAQRLHNLNTQSWTTTATQLASLLHLARVNLTFFQAQASDPTAAAITRIIVEIDLLLKRREGESGDNISTSLSNTTSLTISSLGSNTNTSATGLASESRNHYPFCLSANALLNRIRTIYSSLQPHLKQQHQHQHHHQTIETLSSPSSTFSPHPNPPKYYTKNSSSTNREYIPLRMQTFIWIWLFRCLQRYIWRHVQICVWRHIRQYIRRYIRRCKGIQRSGLL